MPHPVQRSGPTTAFFHYALSCATWLGTVYRQQTTTTSKAPWTLKAGAPSNGSVGDAEVLFSRALTVLVGLKSQARSNRCFMNFQAQPSSPLHGSRHTLAFEYLAMPQLLLLQLQMQVLSHRQQACPCPAKLAHASLSSCILVS